MWNDILLSLSDFFNSYLSQIGMMIVATLLVLYGGEINKQVKSWVSRYHFIVRTLVFVLLCAFGYGLLLSLLTPFVADLLLKIPYLYRGLAIIIILLVLGILAERKRVF